MSFEKEEEVKVGFIQKKENQCTEEITMEIMEENQEGLNRLAQENKEVGEPE